MRFGWLWVALAVLVGGCGSTGSIEAMRAAHGLSAPVKGQLAVCHGHGCAEVSHLALSLADWRRVTRPLARPAATPRGERRQIALALQATERLVGARLGLDGDRPRSPLPARAGQLDCIDETVNVATYLALFDGAGLLRHYRPGRRVTSGYLGRHLFAHTASTIVARESGAEYAVEAWDAPHGALPYIMPLADWRSGAPARHDFPDRAG